MAAGIGDGNRGLGGATATAHAKGKSGMLGRFRRT